MNQEEPPVIPNRTNNNREIQNRAKESTIDTKLLFKDQAVKHSVQKWKSLPTERRERIKSHGKKLGMDEMGTFLVFHYTTREGHFSLNHLLREHRDSELSESQSILIEKLDKALKKLPRSKDPIVFRKIDLPFLGGKSIQDKVKWQKFLSRYSEDKVVMENQFTSTSNDEDHVLSREGNVMFIYKQKSGRDIKPLSFHPEESEILLPRKKYFKVISRQFKNGLMVIELRETEVNL